MEEERSNPAGFIYGVLAIATVIAAESTRRETFAKLLAASGVTLVLYWVAHAYSHHWGSRLQEDSGWTIREVVDSLIQEVPILGGALLPALALAAAWAAGASGEAGVTAALWTAGIEIVALEILVAIRRRSKVRELAVQSGVGILLGLGILAIRVLLH